ncbi:MAG: type II secretion system F family protein, partial [Nitrosopumilaceae archaeon]
ITYMMGQELWLAIALGFVVPSAISGVFVWLQTNEIKKLEDALPQFLRDITEYKKIGYDVSLALIRLSKENSYNKIFDSKLREMRVLIENGTTPTASVMTVSLRSWFTKISFFILAYIAEFGGGNPKTLETITRFMTNAKQAVREGKASVSFYSMLIFVSPVIMVLTASVIHGMVGSIGSSSFQSLVGEGTNQLGQTGLGANFINLITITPEFLTMIKTLIITSSILSAFVIGKAIDFTFYNTWRVVVIGIIAIVSITFMDVIPTLSFENVLGNLPFK